jgi:hypothetical protein
MGTAKATVNAIRVRGVRVVQKHKHAKAASQVRRHGRKLTDPPAKGYVLHNWDPAAAPLIRLWLEAFRLRYQERGDPAALLDALDMWLSSVRGPPAPGSTNSVRILLPILPLPVWIADGVVEALRKWSSHEAPTLDAAFGVRRTAKEQGRARREREEVRFRVMVRIAQLAQDGHPIDDKLFSDVGDEIGRSGKTVSRIFYDQKSAVIWGLLKNLQILTSQKIDKS